MNVLLRSLTPLALLSALIAVPATFADTTGVSRTIPEARPVENSSETKPSIGIMTGITDTQNGRRNGTSYGAEFAYQPYIPIGAAVELSGYVSDHKGDVPTLTRTRLFVKGDYNFGGNIPVLKDSYVGLGLGPVWDNVNHRTDVELGIAPFIGFDIPISGTPISLGANANYMFVGGAKADVFALNGVAKYWF